MGWLIVVVDYSTRVCMVSREFASGAGRIGLTRRRFGVKYPDWLHHGRFGMRRVWKLGRHSDEATNVDFVQIKKIIQSNGLLPKNSSR